MSYIDGFVIPVPNSKMDDYKKMAKLASEVWKEHGALQYVEAVANDVKPGKLTSFPQSVDLKDGETVIFAYVVYKDKAARDSCMEKVMADPRLQDSMKPENMPFDGKRMIFGGFESFIAA